MAWFCWRASVGFFGAENVRTIALGAGCMRRELAGSGSLGSQRMCRWWGPEPVKSAFVGRGRALVIVPLIAYQRR